jgi:mannose-6-phosphate isomerase-like protein (cupin superfamily)/ligand-binding sensor protein/two-component sensor histidine kinase
MTDRKKVNAFNAKRQYFEWGTITWIHDPAINKNSMMLIAHVTFLPGKVQGKHMHTGEEQMLYTISGQGEHWVNDEYYPLLAGTYYHIPAYCEHDIVNTGTSPLEMIITYNINHQRIDELLPKVDLIGNYSEKSLGDLVDSRMLQNLLEELSKAIGLSITLQDDKGTLQNEPVNIPRFCRLYAGSCKTCYLNRQEGNHETHPEYAIQSCCMDLVKVHVPIYFSDRLIGTITCGPVIMNEYSDKTIRHLKGEEVRLGIPELTQEYLKIKRVTKGRLYAILQSLNKIANYIIDIGSKSMINDEIKSKSIEILKEKNARSELERSLFETHMKVIEAQISSHFLFNTLSVIGQLAYMKGAKEAAETTFALSGLLRTSLTKANAFVAVSDELKYIEDYVFIQNKRFSDKIGLEIEIPGLMMDEMIPFMMLQILVENAILHGFEQLEGAGRLHIRGGMDTRSLFFEVRDNGVGISDEAIKGCFSEEDAIGETRGTGIGIKALYRRLKYYYHSFDFNLSRAETGGTVIQLVLPKEKKVSL